MSAIALKNGFSWLRVYYVTVIKHEEIVGLALAFEPWLIQMQPKTDFGERTKTVWKIEHYRSAEILGKGQC